MSAKRRTERLFAIIQILRRARAPITAASVADELETSLRTVYRDIAELIAQRVPVRGEAGIGYMLESGFDMPPLMLTPDEIEAAVLGARWVAGRGDSGAGEGRQRSRRQDRRGDTLAIPAALPAGRGVDDAGAARSAAEGGQLRRGQGAGGDPRPDQDHAHLPG